MLKRISRSPAVQNLAGDLLAGYLRLVRRTSRVVTEPADLDAALEPHYPCIAAMRHGEHFVGPFIRRGDRDVRALITKSRDGAINARAAARLGFGLIRGSGGTPDSMRRKGGATALREMLRALDEGASIVLTADVPKTSRVAGLGIVMLARHSGRPIIPIAVVTSRRIRLNSWDKASLNLPFGRMAMVAGEPIRVPDTDSAEILEAKRREVEDGLNSVHARAYALADGTDG